MSDGTYGLRLCPLRFAICFFGRRGPCLLLIKEETAASLVLTVVLDKRCSPHVVCEQHSFFFSLPKIHSNN
jgi:hypothetical protein